MWMGGFFSLKVSQLLTLKKKKFRYSLKLCHKLHEMSKNQSVVASVISAPSPPSPFRFTWECWHINCSACTHTLFHLLGVSWVLVGQTVGYLITGHRGPEIQLLAELTASVQPQSTALMILMRLRLAFGIIKKNWTEVGFCFSPFVKCFFDS